jgi:hypothetical protein
VIEPDPALRDVYEDGFARYRAATAAITDMLHLLSTEAASATSGSRKA